MGKLSLSCIIGLSYLEAHFNTSYTILTNIYSWSIVRAETSSNKGANFPNAATNVWLSVLHLEMRNSKSESFLLIHILRGKFSAFLVPIFWTFLTASWMDIILRTHSSKAGLHSVFDSHLNSHNITFAFSILLQRIDSGSIIKPASSSLSLKRALYVWFCKGVSLPVERINGLVRRTCFNKVSFGSLPRWIL